MVPQPPAPPYPIHRPAGRRRFGHSRRHPAGRTERQRRGDRLGSQIQGSARPLARLGKEGQGQQGGRQAHAGTRSAGSRLQGQGTAGRMEGAGISQDRHPGRSIARQHPRGDSGARRHPQPARAPSAEAVERAQPGTAPRRQNRRRTRQGIRAQPLRQQRLTPPTKGSRTPLGCVD